MMLSHSLIRVFLLNMLQSQISISLDTNIREVPLFGITNSSMKYNKYEDSNIEYDFGEQNFEKATECINPNIMTFPSENPCYFDWTTGWVLTQKMLLTK